MEQIICPKCGSNKLHKVGFSWSGHNKRQRYHCTNCHSVTIKPNIIRDAEANTGKGLTSACRSDYNGTTES